MSPYWYTKEDRTYQSHPMDILPHDKTSLVDEAVYKNPTVDYTNRILVMGEE